MIRLTEWGKWERKGRVRGREGAPSLLVNGVSIYLSSRSPFLTTRVGKSNFDWRSTNFSLFCWARFRVSDPWVEVEGVGSSARKTRRKGRSWSRSPWTTPSDNCQILSWQFHPRPWNLTPSEALFSSESSSCLSQSPVAQRSACEQSETSTPSLRGARSVPVTNLASRRYTCPYEGMRRQFRRLVRKRNRLGSIQQVTCSWQMNMCMHECKLFSFILTTTWEETSRDHQRDSRSMST